MKKLLFLAIFFCLGMMAFAQKVYFIYIQSEAGTPFYVKMGDKVHSSTASGYLILSKLKDSTYSFYLGQPGNQAKELRFSVPITNTDRGFLLKNFQNGWALFDLQSMAIINAAVSTSGVMYDTNVIKTDLFTRLLAKAVDDSTLLMEPLLTKRKEVILNDAVTQDNAVAASQPPANVAANTAIDSGSKVSEVVKPQEPQAPVALKEPEPEVKEPIAQTQLIQPEQKVQVESSNVDQVAYARSVVKRYAEGSNVEGFSLTYLDTWEGATDTIRLVIPNVIYKNDFVSSTPAPTAAPAQGNLRFLDFTNDEADSLKTPETESVKPSPPADNTGFANSGCRNNASEKDFFGLRKNMAAKERGLDMLAEAKKVFKEKCFTTEQVRNLGVLFLTEEGKLLFFQEAWPHVSDKERFSTLLFELKDASHQERFKALFEK